MFLPRDMLDSKMNALHVAVSTVEAQTQLDRFRAFAHLAEEIERAAAPEDLMYVKQRLAGIFYASTR